MSIKKMAPSHRGKKASGSDLSYADSDRLADDFRRASKEAPGGNRRILLVDDEILIGTLTSEMLIDMGFEVTIESDSVRALEIFKQNPDSFDLVITDQSMPVLTGSELVNAMRKVRSDLPAIFCTGFAIDITDQDFGELGIAAICAKPFDFDLLMQAISKALPLV